MAESKGRPGSAAQRPTGGDKAVVTQKKQYFRRKKVCRFCVEKIDDINYKDTKLLNSFGDKLAAKASARTRSDEAMPRMEPVEYSSLGLLIPGSMSLLRPAWAKRT